MKRCPTCDRTYTDELLNFCLEDGSPLLSDTGRGASAEPPPTLVGGPTSPQQPIQTAQQQTYVTAPMLGNQGSPRMTDQTLLNYSAPPQKRSLLPWILGGAAVLILGVIGLGIVALLLISSSNENRNRTNANSNRNRNSYTASNKTNNRNESNSNSETSKGGVDYSGRNGRYTGEAINTTNDPPARGTATINMLADTTGRVVMVMSFSNGLCGAGMSRGNAGEDGVINLTGTLIGGKDCGNITWEMTTRCTFTETDRLACSYSLANTSSGTQVGSFELQKR